MANGSSSQGGIQFDLNTQAGVLSVLTSIRKSDLSNDERNELRDLAFLFANGGGDKAVREMLEERLLAVGLTAPIQGEAVSAKKESVSSEGESVVETPEPEAPQPQSGYRGGRPTPSFGASNKPTPVKTAATPTAPAPQEPPASAKPQADTPAATLETAQPPSPQPASAEKPATSVVPPAPPKPSSPPTQPAPEPTPADTAGQTTSAPAAPTQSTPPPVAAPERKQVQPPAPAQSSSPAQTTEQSRLTDNDQLKRIREIKADVNHRIGNPVNLIDIDNVVGREYMNSLLEAMRSVSGGTPQSAAQAMGTLETAYQHVIAVLEQHDSNAPAASLSASTAGYGAQADQDTRPETAQPMHPVTPPAQQAVEEKPTESPSEKPSSWAQALSGIKLQVTGRSDDAESEKSPAVAPPAATVQGSASVPGSPLAEPQATSASEGQEKAPEPITPNPEPTPAPSAVTHTEMPSPAPAQQSQLAQDGGEQNDPRPSAVSVEAISPVTATPERAPASAPAVATGVNAVRSLADDPTQLKKPTDLPKEPPRKVGAADHTGDPLYTQAIDEGLEQLLLEWSLFKKSGLFGTGPKGREHPLFKKLAGLQIPLILAGRFEGATQEIKQSVTDYMNGWRYEQGIVYESGETFEHYLRRVIYHILGGDSQ